MIVNLESKLSGLEPIDRDELIELISSWGRTKYFTTEDDIKINKCEPKEKYSLENLDVSQINDLSEIFSYSPYNGDKRFKNNNSLLFLNF